MVGNATPSGDQDHTVSLNVLVHKEKNKVVFAEAGKDFVDFLLSFLTLPLGTIARLVAQESNVQPLKVGSLSTLYESVSHLKENFLWIQRCKEMLLQPRNSMEDYCQKLKLNIDDTEPKSYYFCENLLQCIIKPYLVSTFRNQRCGCGKLMNRVVRSLDILSSENGFVKESASFLVSDDLHIMPNVFGASANLLLKLAIEDFGASANLLLKLAIEDMETLEEQIVDITKKEVLHVLLVHGNWRCSERG
ncbi:hypothetical protein ACSQ67_016399 [Phaseolus vulgaris]